MYVIDLFLFSSLLMMWEAVCLSMVWKSGRLCSWQISCCSSVSVMSLGSFRQKASLRISFRM